MERERKKERKLGRCFGLFFLLLSFFPSFLSSFLCLGLRVVRVNESRLTSVLVSSSLPLFRTVFSSTKSSKSRLTSRRTPRNSDAWHTQRRGDLRRRSTLPRVRVCVCLSGFHKRKLIALFAIVSLTGATFSVSRLFALFLLLHPLITPSLLFFLLLFSLFSGAHSPRKVFRFVVPKAETARSHAPGSCKRKQSHRLLFSYEWPSPAAGM